MTEIFWHSLAFLRRMNSRLGGRTGAWLAGWAFAVLCLGFACAAAVISAQADADRRAEAKAFDAATIAAYTIGDMIGRFDQAILSVADRLQSPTLTSLEEPTRS